MRSPEVNPAARDNPRLRSGDGAAGGLPISGTAALSWASGAERGPVAPSEHVFGSLGSCGEDGSLFCFLARDWVQGCSQALFCFPVCITGHGQGLLIPARRTGLAFGVGLSPPAVRWFLTRIATSELPCARDGWTASWLLSPTLLLPPLRRGLGCHRGKAGGVAANFTGPDGYQQWQSDCLVSY